MSVEIVLLGTVAVRGDDGVPLPAGPRQQRHVLAALAVDAGRRVPVETLVDRVWGAEPPAGARRSLQFHVSRVGRLLERAGAARVDGGSGGYVLRVEPDQVDILRFRRLVEASRAADS